MRAERSNWCDRAAKVAGASNAGDLIDPKCWGFFWHFFVAIPMENLYHCIEQIDTNCDFVVWNWDFMGFFLLIFGCGSGYIYTSNGSATVISQFMFCIISTSVGGMITAAWWLSLSNSDPMIPKIINHLNHESTTTPNREILLPQPVLPFWRMFCFHALIGKVEWGDHWKTQVNEKNKKKNDGDPDDDHNHDHDDEEDDSIEFDASARLYACVKVQSAFSPRSTTRSTSRPTFFFLSVYFINKQQMEEFSVQCKSLNFFLCNHCWCENSGIFRQAVALSHLLDPCSARRCNKVLHPDGRCEKQKKPMGRGTYREIHGILISQSFLETSFETLPVHHFCVCIWLLHTCTSSWDIVWRLIFCELLKHEDGVETLQSWSAFGASTKGCFGFVHSF